MIYSEYIAGNHGWQYMYGAMCINFMWLTTVNAFKDTRATCTVYVVGTPGIVLYTAFLLLIKYPPI